MVTKQKNIFVFIQLAMKALLLLAGGKKSKNVCGETAETLDNPLSSFHLALQPGNLFIHSKLSVHYSDACRREMEVSCSRITTSHEFSGGARSS